MIPYGRQSISQSDIDAVVDVLRSDWLTQGPAVPRFEAVVAEYVGVPHAFAVSNGTAALHLACLALELGPGDLLWTSPITFVASANCGLYCGADVDFVDIDPATYNISAAALEAKLIEAETAGKLPKVLVAVHMTGQPCEMERIAELARRYGFAVIEDAAHAIGGSYKGTKIGSCMYSDLTTFSFHPVKVITTGEGGMITTRRAALAERVELLRTHGITREPSLMEGPSEGPWYYQQVALGFNYRMTDLQAALGASQMDRIDEFVGRRAALAARYDEAFAGLPLTTPFQHPDGESGWHLYVVRVSPEAPVDRATFFARLQAAGIGVNVHYIPVHLQPYYKHLGFVGGSFPGAEQYYAEAVTLPLFPGLSDVDQDTVISTVRQAIGRP